MPDEYKHLFAGENALVDLLKLCEPLHAEQIEQLLALTEYTRFNHLRVKLLEKKGDYVRCLQLFVEGMRYSEYMSNRESAARVFSFIRERLEGFEKARSDDGGRGEGPTGAAGGGRG